jgi:hypothetical protein
VADTATPAPLRDEAAATAASLADPAAADALLAWWRESPDKRWPTITGYLGRVVAGGPDRDPMVDAALQTVGLLGHWDLAVEEARTLAEAEPRSGLVVARARALHGRSGADGRTPEQKKADLEEAAGLLASAPAATGATEKDAAALLHVQILEDLADAAGPGAERTEKLLQAVEGAAPGSARPIAEAGLKIAGELDAAQASQPLTDAQKKRLATAKAALEALRKASSH